MKAKKAGWPKCAEVHSPENREDQAWSQSKVKACSIQWGPNYGKLLLIPTGHYLCKNCGGIVRVDLKRGPFCMECGIDPFEHQQMPDL
jgi:hypothetical protein